jgi:hypothetical protein
MQWNGYAENENLVIESTVWNIKHMKWLTDLPAHKNKMPWNQFARYFVDTIMLAKCIIVLKIAHM